MANQEHLSILKQGVEVWNIWREKSAVKQPDLSGANLNYAYLAGVNFSSVDLSFSNLHHSYLSEANLIQANLSEAQVYAANLNAAYLNEANLVGTNFSQANLSRANLSHADLRYADLNTTVIAATQFLNLDLSLTKGLEACNHKSSSLINNQTLTCSSNLPPIFLKGIGLTAWEISNNKLYQI